MKTVFLRMLEAEDKAAALLGAVREPERAKGRQRFEVDATSFRAIPGSPFAYWTPASVVRLFKSFKSLKQHGYDAMTGAKTNDDPRFLRLVWEVPQSLIALSRENTLGSKRWARITRGGPFSPCYHDIDSAINWGEDGRCIKAFISDYRGRKGWGYQWSANLNGHDWYFLPGLTWPLRGIRFSARPVPQGCLPSGAGKMAYAPKDELLGLLAVANSQIFDAIVRLFAGKVGGVQYEAGLLQQVLVPTLSNAERGRLAACARRAWSLKRSLDTRSETSHAFTLPALLQVAGADISTRAAAWSDHVRTVEAELAAILSEIDARCFDLYDIDVADRHTITEGFGSRGSDSEEATSDGANDAEDDAEEDTDENDSTSDPTGLAAEFVSWAVGVAFGRFDAHLATGARPLPVEPEPFDPLPACSPGMLTGGEGLPLAQPPAGYPLAFPEAGVLVDDLGHSQDLPTAVRAVFDVVFGAAADRWWTDVAALLEPKGHDLRVWLAGSFFEHHLKRHSKSRRKAPIVWQLGTPSGRNSVWLYAHRLKRDSFFQLQNEVVGPKLAHEERQLTSLIQNAGGSPSAPERKEIAAQEAVVEELRAMLDEVKRVAPLWNPNLDDGVVLTMAPLWRLVPQHKPWQKELKSKWDELAAGKHDWAHIAMHLWPERVVPKCAADRSLAIGHGLEEAFWVIGADGKWTARATPVKPLDEIVGERASPAVKAALKSLLEAPTGRGSKPSSRSIGYR